MKKGFTLIELLVVIGILAILLAITLIAINPSRQFKQANDTKRASDVNTILNAVGQYAAELTNKGNLPAGIPSAGTAFEIKAPAGADGVDLCTALVPTFIQALPADPLTNGGAPVTAADCATGNYNTGYYIEQDANGRVTVSAPAAQITTPIEVTR